MIIFWNIHMDHPTDAQITTYESTRPTLAILTSLLFDMGFL
jgi:hypothetical protein